MKLLIFFLFFQWSNCTENTLCKSISFTRVWVVVAPALSACHEMRVQLDVAIVILVCARAIVPNLTNIREKRCHFLHHRNINQVDLSSVKSLSMIYQWYLIVGFSMLRTVFRRVLLITMQPYWESPFGRHRTRKHMRIWNI